MWPAWSPCWRPGRPRWSARAAALDRSAARSCSISATPVSPGALYAVSPHGGDIEGIPCVPSVAALPEAPDLAVVAVPAARVVEVAEECGRRGVGSLVVITSGLDASAGIRPAGGHPARGHAPGRPELLRRRGARDRAGGHVRRAPPFPRPQGPGGPVRRGRRGAGGAVLPAGHRDLLCSPRSATSWTSPAPTCCCGGRRTTPPSWPCCTWNPSATRAGSPGPRAG